MTDSQLQAWLRGEPYHNRERDECCPDFSCCQPHLLASIEVRRAFVLADESARFAMLGNFLSAAIADCGNRERVHIVGEGRNEH